MESSAAASNGVASTREEHFKIQPARSLADIDATSRLFRAYSTALGIDLTFQDFSIELASMPGKYAPPAGELLLARDHRGQPLGCVGLRPIMPDGYCEMKRLYVSPDARELGLGRALIDAVVAEAKRREYRAMRLDTLPSMGQAIALYEQAGFVAVEPYYETPLEGTVFLELRLRDQSKSSIDL